MDFEIIPKSFQLTLPSFDAGPLDASTAGQQVFGPREVSFQFMDDADIFLTLNVVGEPPETYFEGGPSTYSFTGDLNSVIDLSLLGDVNAKLLNTTGPYTDSFDQTEYENDPDIGLITMNYGGTETWTNLQVGLTPVPVPLPAGGWVFLSALGGLLAYSRRRVA